MSAREVPPVDGGALDRRFPASERLGSKAEYRSIFEEGTAFHGSRLVLFLLQHPDLERRVGIVAGRKAGGSVNRSRAKRLLREAYRHARPHLPTRGFQVVLVARRGCAGAAFSEVNEELRRLLGRAGYPIP